MNQKVKTTGWWMDRIHASVGKFINLETVDGGVREGRLSGLRLITMTFNGTPVDVVQELELNGDPTDTIPVGRLSSIHIQSEE